MRHAMLLAALVLAGCTQDAAPEPPAIEPGPDQHAASFAAEGCPLTFPDGSAVDCDAATWTQPSGTEPPAVTDGWRCTRDHKDDHGTVYQLWAHADGRAGAYFEGVPWKDRSVAVFSVQTYTPDGGWAALVPHQPTAFVELPDFPESGRVDLHLVFSQMRLFELPPGEEAWNDDPAGAELIADTFGGHPWYVWKVPKDNGTFYLSHMHAEDEPEELRSWKARHHEAVAPDGAQYIADTFRSGIKFLDRQASDFTFTAAGSCQIT